MRRIITLICSSALLCGCTTFEPLRPDMEARPLPSRLDEIAYVNVLREAFAVTSNGDEGAPPACYSGAKLHAFKSKFGQGYVDHDEDAESVADGCVTFRKLKGEDAIDRYMEAGFGLSDIYCDRFFTVAGQSRQSRRVQRNAFKVADTLFNSFLTVLRTGETAVGLSSAGFSAVDGAYGAIDDAFVVAPDRDDVRKLVQGAQQIYRADAFRAANKPKSYVGARAVLTKYAWICSFDGMKSLVTSSLKEKAEEQEQVAQQARESGGDGDEEAKKKKVEKATGKRDLTVPITGG
ncbi:hypothetical protein [Sphingomonas astaxanthinifaciens]|uniref:Lipoprotein n=1 Tax=Sphingomonas astaxanthinifaciens DSM 22298 TaxID=1123267 RepID=A0ABQ5Z5L8_9SPHN|nr:hypothetical protein [Sphingomonas astaxanthinifaciens]GLR48074.1 hypothetical protein GCM10007925_17870 [Sphingomonas astaxanthinifaciens DSM 22298]